MDNQKLSSRLSALAEKALVGVFSTRPIPEIEKDQARLRWEIGHLVLQNQDTIISALQKEDL